jgi:hypothetical protein
MSEEKKVIDFGGSIMGHRPFAKAIFTYEGEDSSVREQFKEDEEELERSRGE